MVDRFAWGATGELIPADDLDDETGMQEGRHSAPWREELHPRGEDGQFTSGGGGGSSSGSGSSGSRSSADTSTAAPSATGVSAEQDRKAAHLARLARIDKENADRAALAAERTRLAATDPDAINRRAYVPSFAEYDPRTDVLTMTIDSQEIPNKSGDLIAYRVAGNNDHTYVKSGDRTVVLNDDEINKIRSAVDNPYGQGGDDDDNESRKAALTSKDGYHFGYVHPIPGKGNRVRVDIDRKPAFELGPKEALELAKAHDRLSYARRLTAEYDTVDVLDRGRGIALRTKGEDGAPVEMPLRLSSAERVKDAFGELVDDQVDSPQKVKTEKGEFVITRDTPPGEEPAITITMPNGRVLTFDTQDQQWEFQSALIHVLNESARPDTTSRAEARPLTEHVPLTEAATGITDFQPTSKGRYRVLLIKAGRGASGHYTEEVLRRDGPRVFPAGTRMYMDHPTLTEKAERPEGSTLNWASVTTTDAAWDPAWKGLVSEVEVFPHWRHVLNPEYAKHIGLSIRASGTVEAGEVDGRRTLIVTSLGEGTSVDWVTQAGAGGRVLQLIESARTTAPQEGAMPPFQKAKDEDEEPDGADVEDEETDDDEEEGEKKLPAFLKAKGISEAGNVGAWVESRLHLTLTALADDMYGDGLLTRPERLALSTGIGDALTAFTTRLQAEQPQLFTRDRWQQPPPAVEPAPAVPAAPKPGDLKVVEDEQGILPDEDEEGTMPDLTESQRELAEAQRVAAAATEELARFRAVEAARPIAVAVLAESGLPAAAQTKLLATVTSATVPLAESAELDEAKLRATLAEAVTAEKTYLASLAEADGVGRVRGLGESASSGDQVDTAALAATTTGLTEAYKSKGMTAEAAALAAAGRPF
ncbi:hypothetical protein [Streptosporangium sp. NPDC002721]|uniref:hypothetical protein n=1 Tax=Streptosporangium sp. NPDC002721 TaxID=3366188 RepID=UPI0036C866D9